MKKIETPYNYEIPILYETKAEEAEACNIDFKQIFTDIEEISFGILYGSTHNNKSEKYEEAMKSGNYIKWKQMRKNYADCLDTNPFEVGDSVVCIKNSSSSTDKNIGDVFTITNAIGRKINYKKGFSASYKDFKLNSSLLAKDWRDAFIEEIGDIYVKDIYSAVKVLKCNSHSQLSKSSSLLTYVSLFEKGGFWFNEDGLNFRIVDNPLATYAHAKDFISSWKDRDRL